MYFSTYDNDLRICGMYDYPNWYSLDDELEFKKTFNLKLINEPLNQLEKVTY